MTSELSQTRLIYVAPRLGVGGVGDYSQDFVTAVRPYFSDVVEYRHGPPGDDGVAALRKHRRAIRKLVDEAPGGRVLVHAEMSGGALVPFWSLAALPAGITKTATLHDPPHPIWWPARTRFMAQHRLVNHGLHFPLRRASYYVQRWGLGAQTLFVLTESGKRSIEESYPRAHVVHVPHLIVTRAPTRQLQERPMAIGFFGLIYRGKGFELVGRLRRLLPDHITIRVAGRGTESLTPAPGIEIVGAVEGPAEDAFFESVRVIAMPYGRRSPYGMGYPASGVLARSIAYDTPVICTDHGALGDLDDSSGAVVLRDLPSDDDSLARAFATAIQSLLDDEPRLVALGAQVSAERLACSVTEVAAAFAATWSSLLEPTATPR